MNNFSQKQTENYKIIEKSCISINLKAKNKDAFLSVFIIRNSKIFLIAA